MEKEEKTKKNIKNCLFKNQTNSSYFRVCLMAEENIRKGCRDWCKNFLYSWLFDSREKRKKVIRLVTFFETYQF